LSEEAQVEKLLIYRLEKEEERKEQERKEKEGS